MSEKPEAGPNSAAEAKQTKGKLSYAWCFMYLWLGTIYSRHFKHRIKMAYGQQVSSSSVPVWRETIDKQRRAIEQVHLNIGMTYTEEFGICLANVEHKDTRWAIFILPLNVCKGIETFCKQTEDQ